MATNRTRRTRQFKPTTISDALRNYLETGDYDRDAEGAKDVLVMRFDRTTGQEWERVKDELIDAWISKHPATRPWGCWEFETTEQRRRVGGIGDPAWEHLAYVEHYEFGLPAIWITKFDEEYYNNRRLDIHGKLIETPFKDGDFKGKAIDPEDPPLYESEATYLQRHGLLTPGETKWLKDHTEALTPGAIED